VNVKKLLPWVVVAVLAVLFAWSASRNGSIREQLRSALIDIQSAQSSRDSAEVLVDEAVGALESAAGELTRALADNRVLESTVRELEQTNRDLEADRDALTNQLGRDKELIDRLRGVSVAGEAGLDEFGRLVDEGERITRKCQEVGCD
jgi:chromosome segregation ATPase